MYTFIVTVVVGGIIGWIASIVAKTSNQMGCLWNILIGICGAAIGSFLAEKMFHYHVPENMWNWPRFGVGIGGAVLLIIVLRTIGILRSNR
jgi:uncharacterized membrane protein YeaQ/YmgE (transglycosylase-associated protein family)